MDEDRKMIRLHFAQITVADGRYSATCGDCNECIEGRAEGDWTVVLVSHAEGCSLGERT